MDRKTASLQSEPASPGSPPGGRARRSPTTRSPRHGRAQGCEEHGQADQPPQDGGHQYDAVPQDDPDEEGEWQGWTSWYDRWTPEQWREWLKDKKTEKDEESDVELRWDELEMEEIEVLPDELLGWLLLRRANLPAAARLSVQASVQNSFQAPPHRDSTEGSGRGGALAWRSSTTASSPTSTDVLGRRSRSLGTTCTA